MNETLTVSASQAAQEVAAHVRQMNAGKNVPAAMPLLKALAEERKVYIHNVSPFAWPRHMGSTGTFIIKAREEGQDYAEPLMIPGVVFEPVIKGDEKNMDLQQDEGRYVAEQIVGIGKHLRPSDALTQWGVFISSSAVPSKKELAEALRLLRLNYQGLVKEMNDAHAMGPQKARETLSDHHFIAARALGYTKIECPWLADSEAPADRANCPGCGKSYVVGILRCECQYVLDQEGFKKAVAEGRYAAPAGSRN